MNNFIPAQSGLSRVFIIEGRARSDRRPKFFGSVRAMALEQGFGDTTNIYIPDPRRYDRFKVAGQIKGEEERPTTQLQGRWALDVASELLRLAKIQCPVDVQLHLGQCTDPSEFSEFTKAVILEAAQIPNWATDEVGALQPDEKNPVNETADISAALMYEVLEVTAAERADDIVTNEVIDVIFCDAISCGECEEQSAGCNKIFAITLAAGGSPGTPADVVFSLDAGDTWGAHDIDSLGIAENPSAIACVKKYVVVVSSASNSLHYALKSEFNGYTDPGFTEVTTGFVAGGEPNAIESLGSMGFVVGEGGYIYLVEDPTGGVTVLDAGAATVDDLNAVDALDEQFAVAVGDSGAVVYTENQSVWQQTTTRPVGIGVNLTCVLVHSENYWLVGSANGRLFSTFNKGETWNEVTFPGSGSGSVRDIVRSTDSVLWMAHDTTVPVGRILRSYDGGHEWGLIPEGTASLPDNNRISALAACEFDPNVVVGVGLGGNGTDGFVVLCQD